jgi:hypothetical protein
VLFFAPRAPECLLSQSIYSMHRTHSFP